MINCVGFEHGKYLIKESVPGIKLRFTGEDASKFRQVDIPKKPTESVEFGLTVEYLNTEFPGFLTWFQ